VVASLATVPSTARWEQKLRAWLDRPLSGWACVIGWCVATTLFVGLVALLGGLSGNDTFESVFSTWAIAHGQLACALPQGYRVTAPLYPLVSGGVAALTHIGHGVPFTSPAAMGPHCEKSFLAINYWSERAGVLQTTLKIGYLSWLILMAGVIALLRAAGRGRCRWEPTTLILIACLPPVWACLQSTFHPEDLFAMGLLLAAVACAVRGSWVGAGILIALAVLSQQFAILIAAPLLVLAPRSWRFAYVGAAALTVGIVSAPFLFASSDRSAHAIFLGTGDTNGVGGSVLWELNLHGLPLLFISRVMPVAVAAAIAWWLLRRLGQGALQPALLVALVAVSLSLRLVFEQNFYLYYFMALSVSLLLLDVVRGHIRASLAAWLLIVPTVYAGEIEIPKNAVHLAPLCAIALALIVMVARISRGDPRRTLLPWLAVVVASVITSDRVHFGFLSVPPTWFWQILLVVPGVLLAVGPLRAEVRRFEPSSHFRQVRTP